MPNKIKWSAQASEVTLIAGATSSPTLKNLASGGRKLGNAYDQDATANRDQYVDIQLKVTFAVAPTAGDVVSLYLLPIVDGTNYEDGSDTVTPQRTPDRVFSVRAVTTVQYLIQKHILFPASDVKPLIINDTGEALSNVDNENELTMRAYTDEVQ